ncbi:hypothetical protein Syun_017080 [Stephania yunnanensis]|uniref:Uncharacterized protein n=1 Tax=Stephania yunnanensis TaxID=152371 RepID=A0AAP0J8I0_9MAGN
MAAAAVAGGGAGERPAAASGAGEAAAPMARWRGFDRSTKLRDDAVKESGVGCANRDASETFRGSRFSRAADKEQRKGCIAR